MLPLHYQRDSHYAPERGGVFNWHVWDTAGAVEVLRRREFESAEEYTVAFANGSYADIRPGEPLWELLADIARSHRVKVFQLFPGAEYVIWDGSTGSLRQFDTISIGGRVGSTVQQPDANEMIGDEAIDQSDQGKHKRIEQVAAPRQEHRRQSSTD